MTSETQTKLWALAAFVAALAFAASPFLAPGFKGFEPTQFPVPQVDPAVQPAGYAFSIWGLIYVWLLLGTGYGLWKRADDPDWAPMRPALVASLAVGALWLPVAEASVPLATLLIWIMLGTALVAVMRAGDTDRWWQLAPVAIYAGWLTAASSVSIGLVLAGYGILPETPAALLALVLALRIAVTVQYRLHRAPEYGITVIWALAAVIVANAAPFNAAVVGLAVLGIGAILAIRGTDTE
ncbi:tryptophan-rich sensory protein [Roseivivax halodurans]|uniref:tryptophan-rich sensory protein n=1 Tax=Roseivivax halodurans TaxID=93683 RepID=UPI00055C78B7|nr:tryptophan-rich sensory protein [Roseivivax halodurans]